MQAANIAVARGFYLEVQHWGTKAGFFHFLNENDSAFLPPPAAFPSPAKPCDDRLKASTCGRLKI
jgi:hypothetical protein